MRNILILLVFLATGCHVVRKSDRPVADLPDEAIEAVPPAQRMEQGVGEPGDEDTARALKVFLAGLPEGYQSLMVHSPALDGVAAARAWTAGLRNHSPTELALRWLLHRAGEPAAWDQGGWSWAKGGRDPDRRVLAQLQKRARQLILRRVPHAFGVALVRINTGHYAGALVLVERPLQLDPMPREVAPGAPLEVTGQVSVPVKSLKAYLLRPDGGVESPAVERTGDRFRISLPALAAGTHALELAGTRIDAVTKKASRWVNTMILLPVRVGVPEPAGPATSARRAPETVDAARLGAWLVAEVNAERARLGLGVLAEDGGLRALADKRQAQWIRDDEPEPLFRAAGDQVNLPKGGYREFGGSARYLDDRLDASLLMPRLRAILLDPDARWVGLALNRADEDGEDTRRYPTFRYHFVVVSERAPGDGSSEATD